MGIWDFKNWKYSCFPRGERWAVAYASLWCLICLTHPAGVAALRSNQL